MHGNNVPDRQVERLDLVHVHVKLSVEGGNQLVDLIMWVDKLINVMEERIILELILVKDDFIRPWIQHHGRVQLVTPDLVIIELTAGSWEVRQQAMTRAAAH